MRTGATFQAAALAAGVGCSTFRLWRQRGRADRKAKKRSSFVAFLADVKKAAAQFITENVKAISDHGGKSWQARAWLLERRRPDLFGDQRAEVRRLSKVVEQLLAELAKFKVPDAATPQGPQGDPGGPRADHAPADQGHGGSG